MPIQTFLCPECGNKFFKLFRVRSEFEAAVTMNCPECDAQAPITPSVPARRNPIHGLQN
jgi:predicted nucleic acid-binding Zn ribbon protein